MGPKVPSRVRIPPSPPKTGDFRMTIKPKDLLTDDCDHAIIKGVKVRKGTIRAALANAKILASKSASQEEKTSALSTIRELAPALAAFDMHNLVVWKNAEIQKIVEDAAKMLGFK